jgi:hypothetical protein
VEICTRLSTPAREIAHEHRGVFQRALAGEIDRDKLGLRINRHEGPEVARADAFARLKLRLLLAHVAPNFVALDTLAMQVAHLLEHQFVATLTDLKAKAHHGIAVRPCHALNRTDGVALNKGSDDLGAAFDGKAVDHGLTPNFCQRLYACISCHASIFLHGIGCKQVKMTDREKNLTKVAGGLARRDALTAEERSAIARNAAMARYGKPLPKAIAEGTLKIGDLPLPCAVLDDPGNTRVFTQEGFLLAIGRAAKAKGGEGASVDGKPAFLRAKNLEPFISSELLASTTPVEFIPYKGPGYLGRAFGYRAKLLPQVCWVFQDAAVAKKLLPSQKHIGEQCRVLLKALTDHAIDDLVDRATGFEDQRKLQAFYQSIEKHVRKDALPWVQMYDIEFYRQVYRLNRWPFDPGKTARPGVIGHWTNDIYDRMALGVRGALHARVRRNASGWPTQKLTQYLNKEAGKPRLKELLEGVKALMRVSTDWIDFQSKLDIAFPKFEEMLTLPFDGGLPRLPKPKPSAE